MAGFKGRLSGGILETGEVYSTTTTDEWTYKKSHESKFMPRNEATIPNIDYSLATLSPKYLIIF